MISPILISLYVNDMPSPSHHVELALYEDDTAITANAAFQLPGILSQRSSTVVERMENRH